MNAPEVLEKIKKLLRLARSSNPHEAALAMAKAMALAAEHRVCLSQVDPDQEATHVTHRDHEDRLARLSAEHHFAALICQRFFRVRCIVRNSHARQFIAIVGATTDAEIALYVLGFLVHHFRFCWRHHRGRVRNRKAFMSGMFNGLYAKLREDELPAEKSEASNALVVSLDAYIATHIGETKKKKAPECSADASAARRAGFNQGQKTNIRGAIKPSEAAPLALS
ncbi:MAG: DUF2786 domain-containing protein [Burkholderiales bacterium]|nr:DUF2786 domain-containing protein [Opitutaceae bacterium]